MKTSLHKIASYCRGEVYRFMVLGVACFLVSACATMTPADPSLEAARVKLMEGTITRDQSVIQPLLAPDFTWREDNAPLDEEPYDFWNRHRLWKDLNDLVKQKPIAKAGLMIAPKEATRAGYSGARLAWRKVGGEWKLAYFYASSEAPQ